ncbi:MAG: OmpA family protein [Saprospiraceae bacterium]|nr:OmpA family protein [Saprospiraceae bacterium]
MTPLLILICLVLITIVVIQIGKVTELASSIRGEEDTQVEINRWSGILSLVFVVVFLIGCVYSAAYYKNYMLGYGPHDAASAHGSSIDFLFDVTLFFTGIVFVITHIALFWFAYKYQGKKDRQAEFISHNNKLEVIWTLVPAIVMTLLVISGLDAWNEIMPDVGDDEDYIEIEATGVQYNWLLRYPGPDNLLGTRNFKLITGVNPLGQDWTDPKNQDDLQPSEIVLPVNKKVRVRITSRDVLHSFFLPHFRVKMDAVPGIPTYFIFTPTKTTEEYRQSLSYYPEYQVPSDPDDPEGPQRWETFEYELACAELCGMGHFSMRRVVRIVSEAEYEAWLSQQNSYYLGNIRNGDEDPLKGKLLDVEITQHKKEFTSALNLALSAPDSVEKVVQLNYVQYETGAANLTSDSRYELDNLVEALKANSNMRIEIAGHTDNVGDAVNNMALSQSRANVVAEYLQKQGVDASRFTARGYGQTRPLVSNDTDENRAKNRRTEFRILSN